MHDAQWWLTGKQRKVSCTGFLCEGVSRMSPCGLTGLLLAPWWARLQHYASLTGLPLLSIIVLSETHNHTHTRTNTHSYRRAPVNTCRQVLEPFFFLRVRERQKCFKMRQNRVKAVARTHTHTHTLRFEMGWESMADRGMEGRWGPLGLHLF